MMDSEVWILAVGHVYKSGIEMEYLVDSCKTIHHSACNFA